MECVCDLEYLAAIVIDEMIITWEQQINALLIIKIQCLNLSLSGRDVVSQERRTILFASH